MRTRTRRRRKTRETRRAAARARRRKWTSCTQPRRRDRGGTLQGSVSARSAQLATSSIDRRHVRSLRFRGREHVAPALDGALRHGVVRESVPSAGSSLSAKWRSAARRSASRARAVISARSVAATPCMSTSTVLARSIAATSRPVATNCCRASVVDPCGSAARGIAAARFRPRSARLRRASGPRRASPSPSRSARSVGRRPLSRRAPCGRRARRSPTCARTGRRPRPRCRRA
jgi:hypothetical protein